MNRIALAILLTVATGCGGLLENRAFNGALNLISPASFANPFVVAKSQLCVTELTTKQRARVQKAADSWNAAFPAGNLRLTTPTRCKPLQPVVRVNPEMPERRSGYTVPSLSKGFVIEFRSDARMTQCVVNHELGHYLGLFKHASLAEPAGPMTDGNRGPCEPTAADVAILTRTYTGKVSL